MRQKLATLEVYLDPDATREQGLSSGLEGRDGSKQYKLVLRPQVDKTIFSGIHGLNPKLEPMQTIIAHELGHFVAKMTDDVTHRGADHFSLQDLVPVEKKAWDIAEEMGVELDPMIKKAALDTYQERDERTRASRRAEQDFLDLIYGSRK